MRAVTWCGTLVVSGGMLVGAAPAVATGSPALAVRIDTWGDARPGGRLDFLVTAANQGASATRKVRLDVAVPRGIDVIGLPDGCRERRRLIRCRLGVLAPKAIRKVTVSGIVRPTARGAQTVVAEADGASARTSVRVKPGTDLAVRLRTPQGTDGSFAFAARALNQGKRSARKVSVTVAVRGARFTRVPAGCMSSAHRVTCDAAALDPGAMVRFAFRAKAEPGRKAAEVFATVGAAHIGETRPADNGAFTSVPVVRFAQD
ncbi:hypothetical protein EDD29_7860 [Actinocorallia herbida]|uniref:DUF11 domain-containing protein n=1 Tax=Actinocorallia herbida TaxID=58109 RepID=A0A3N1D9D4_9ACTN|nr:hypothetical protein [Actinocorallia herbida]ROO90144.1 hypothetical protein EDD29_7860 [Actinocorallia herbida]